jgi:hypothetical protein
MTIMGQFNMTEETILRAVMEDRMFGALEVDLVVPDHLKVKFAGLRVTPIFVGCNVHSPVLHHMMYLRHLQTMLGIPLQQRRDDEDLLAKHTSNQTLLYIDIVPPKPTYRHIYIQTLEMKVILRVSVQQS